MRILPLRLACAWWGRLQLHTPHKQMVFAMGTPISQTQRQWQPCTAEAPSGKSFQSANVRVAVFAYRCDNGCTCDPQYRDGTLTYDQVVVFIDTVHPSPAPKCLVSFTLTSNSTAGAKLRVSGIAVNGDSGDIQGRIGEEKYMAWLTGTEWAA
jgi:hypothetical protein